MSRSTTKAKAAARRRQPDIAPSEYSFSLIETILSMSILATVVLQIGGAQGNLAYLATYSRNMVKATWYAKRIMSNIDYQASYLPFKALNTTLKQNIPIKSGKENTEFTYNLQIEEWKFPILDALFQDKGGAEGGPNAEVVANAVKQILGDHRLKIARVEVFWPEGAKRNSITVAQLLTNQASLNRHLVSLAPTYKSLLDKVAGIEEQKPPKTEAECKKRGGRWNKATQKCENIPSGGSSSSSGGSDARP